MRAALSIRFFCIFIGLLFTILNGCQYGSSPKLTVEIQPFDDMPEAYLKSVHKALEKVVGPIYIRKPISLPKTALNHNKNRYRADSILKYLTQINNTSTFLIGLTASDISTTKNGIQDWGVMGLGYCPGSVCVASSYRLKNTNKAEQLFKVAIHELGHTQGLPHCKEKTCFTRDANGKNPTDEEKAFCEACKKYLLKRGLKLN